MTPADALGFLGSNTPLFQVVVLYVLLYRCELGRFLHPIRERSMLKDWVAVLSNLKLMRGAQSPALEEELKVERWRVSRTRALYLLSFLVLWLSAVLISKMVAVQPPLLEMAFPFLLQFLPSITLALAIYRYCGSKPIRPKAVNLPKGRKGSLLRYLRGDI